MCNCKSYNNPQPDQTDDGVMLHPHEYGMLDLNKPVCVDACIVEQIKALWGSEIKTGGCCCGHCENGIPSVILYYADEVEAACRALRLFDPNRPWHVTVWSHEKPTG